MNNLFDCMIAPLVPYAVGGGIWYQGENNAGPIPRAKHYAGQMSRMVQDDGVSPRLRLRRGRNILRFALVNGPGLSDFCVRFIDEQGNPVTGYSVSTIK